MTGFQRLFKIELPLSFRSSWLVFGQQPSSTGMAALAFLIGGGGMETINAGLKLNRPTAIFVGAVLVALVALAFDFIGGLAQRYLRRRGSKSSRYRLSGGVACVLALGFAGNPGMDDSRNSRAPARVPRFAIRG